MSVTHLQPRSDAPHGVSERFQDVVATPESAMRQGAFAPLLDAKGASKLLGVPHTWLLSQARAERIPHHRLGHYVRFDPADLQQWLRETRIAPRRASA
ncbi:MAG: helix-turn-helix domain-containing protein [Solirubrobacteraceae bacterium]